MFNLTNFGWDGCTVPSNLVDLCKHVPTWKDLKILREPVILNGFQVRFPVKFFVDSESDKYMPAFIKSEQIDDGGYAQIYKGRRAIFVSDPATVSTELHLLKKTPFRDVCLKEILISVDPDEDAAPPEKREKFYEDEINAILYEAFLHALLCKTMESAAHPCSVPTMYEVVATSKKEIPEKPSDLTSIWITMEFIQGQTLEKYLKNHLKIGHTTENESIIKDVILQLAFYLNILQTQLRFNHRDLKVNNVFVRAQDPAWTQTLTLPTGRSWTCGRDIMLIDFGFSCVACGECYPNPRATLLGAGSWFTPKDDCLKYGRDLAQFLYSLHCLFYLPDYVSCVFFDALYAAMNVKWMGRNVNLFHGIEPNGVPSEHAEMPKPALFNDGIYIFLRFTKDDILGCAPEALIRALQAI